MQFLSSPTETSVWGLRGSEDLGGGNKVIFKLGSAFSTANGTSWPSGRIFGDYAWIGLSSTSAGTIKLGRMLDSVGDYLGDFAATGSWGARSTRIHTTTTIYGPRTWSTTPSSIRASRSAACTRSATNPVRPLVRAPVSPITGSGPPASPTGSARSSSVPSTSNSTIPATTHRARSAPLTCSMRILRLRVSESSDWAPPPPPPQRRRYCSASVRWTWRDRRMRSRPWSRWLRIRLSVSVESPAAIASMMASCSWTD